MFWIVATLCIFVSTDETAIILLITACSALVCVILWTVAVYELKIEYVFSAENALQGYVVGMDRAIVSSSSLVFLAAVPPERIPSGPLRGGRLTFFGGALAFAFGTFLVYIIKHKRRYKREEFETRTDAVVSDLDDVNEVFLKHEPENQVETIEPEKKVSV